MRRNVVYPEELQRPISTTNGLAFTVIAAWFIGLLGHVMFIQEVTPLFSTTATYVHVQILTTGL